MNFATEDSTQRQIPAPSISRLVVVPLRGGQRRRLVLSRLAVSRREADSRLVGPFEAGSSNSFEAGSGAVDLESSGRFEAGSSNSFEAGSGAVGLESSGRFEAGS
jgi:hypothetical protein